MLDGLLYLFEGTINDAYADVMASTGMSVLSCKKQGHRLFGALVLRVVPPGQQNIINNQSFKIKKPCFWSHFSHTTSSFAIFNNNLTFCKRISPPLFVVFRV